MSSIRFLTSSDEHLAELSPGLRKDDYRSAILRKLEWQGNLATRSGASAVLRGGDFFHVKAANKTTMATLVDVASLHRRYPCPTFAMAGNHDMSHNDPSSIPRQPIGLMLETGVFKPLRDESFEDGTMRVRVVGVQYTTDLADDGLRDLVRKRPGDTYTVAFVHALAAMAPEERIQAFFNERVFDYRDLVFEGCPDVYVFGHYHKDQGVVDHLGVKFVNLGAVSRGALLLEELERKPKVALITCDSRGVNVEPIPVPCADPSEVFNLELKARMEKERRSLDDFVSLLRSGASPLGGCSVQDRVDIFKLSPEFPDDLKSLVLELLESAESGVTE